MSEQIRMLRCQLCDKQVDRLTLLRFWIPSGDGVKICAGCYQVIQANRKHPYSKIMDRLALKESGYYINRKLARRHG